MERVIGKKKRLDLNKLQFTFDFTDVIDYNDKFSHDSEYEYELNLTRWFSSNYDYNVNILWGDYIHESHVRGNPRNGFTITDINVITHLEETYTSNEVKHLYRINDNLPIWPTTLIKDDVDGNPFTTELVYLDENNEPITDPSFFDENGIPLRYLFTSVGGVVNVTMSGADKMNPEIPFLGTEEGEEVPLHDSITDCLTSVRIPIYYYSPLKNARATFCNCSKLSYVDGRIFRYCEEAEDFSMMFKGTRIYKVQPYMLFHCPNIKNVTAMFEASQLKQISSKFFSRNTLITNISRIFQRCAGLTYLPDGLFDNCHEITDVSMAFKQMPRCEYLSPTLLTPDNHPNIIKCKFAFANGYDYEEESWYYSEDDDISKISFKPSTVQGFKSVIPYLAYKDEEFSEVWVEYREDECSLVYIGCNNCENYDEIETRWRMSSIIKTTYPIPNSRYIDTFLKQRDNDIFEVTIKITNFDCFNIANAYVGANGRSANGLIYYIILSKDNTQKTITARAVCGRDLVIYTSQPIDIITADDVEENNKIKNGGKEITFVIGNDITQSEIPLSNAYINGLPLIYSSSLLQHLYYIISANANWRFSGVDGASSGTFGCDFINLKVKHFDTVLNEYKVVADYNSYYNKLTKEHVIKDDTTGNVIRLFNA